MTVVTVVTAVTAVTVVTVVTVVTKVIREKKLWWTDFCAQIFCDEKKNGGKNLNDKIICDEIFLFIKPFCDEKYNFDKYLFLLKKLVV